MNSGKLSNAQGGRKPLGGTDMNIMKAAEPVRMTRGMFKM